MEGGQVCLHPDGETDRNGFHRQILRWQMHQWQFQIQKREEVPQA